jgi:hypothetical protein
MARHDYIVVDYSDYYYDFSDVDTNDDTDARSSTAAIAEEESQVPVI